MADQSDWAVRLIDGVTGPAKKAASSAGRLERALKNMVKGTNTSRDELGKFVKGSGGMFDGFGKSFKGMGKKLGDGFTEGIGKIKEGGVIAGAVVAAVAVGMTAATIKMADFAQTTRIGFQSVAKHGASAEKLFTHFRGVAEDLGLDVMATNKQAVKFLALQFDPKMATDLLKMGADMRALGADAEGVDRIFSQLGQIQAKGKLQGEELIVLAENGLSTQLVYEALGKQLGKTKDEILKMQDAGKLTSDMAFPAIMAAVMKKTGTKELGEAGKKVADQTLSGMAGQLKAKAQNMFIDIATQATPAIMGAFKPIGDELSALFKNQSVKDGIIIAVETIGNLVRDGIPFVKQFVASFSDGFSEAWPAIKGVLGTLFDGFGGGATWMDTVREFATLLGKVTAFGIGVATVFGGMVMAGIQGVTAVTEGLIFLWNGMIGGIGTAAFAVSDFFANVAAKWRAFDFGALATSLIDGLVNGIRGGIQRVVGAVTELGSSTLASLKGVLGIKSPSKEFAWLGEMSGAGFNQGLDNSFDTVGPRVSSLTGGAMNDVGSSGGGASGPLLHIDHLTIQVGAGAGADARQTGREVALGFEEELGSVIERLRLEAA
jgi:tape measure domain-containing protein